MNSLKANPDRKFTYCEQAYFTRWWREQSDSTQNLVKGFVKNGQLIFVDGGWTQHDEANPHFVTMIDQTTLGHNFLLETFNYKPTIGWQIDPFGHSSTQASLLSAELGFNALYFARIDYQDRDLREATKKMEMIWRSSPSLGESAEIFTGAFVEGNYGAPPGLCWDQSCSNALPVMDDQCLEDENSALIVETVVQLAMQYANETRGTNILFLMGSDFQYENADEWYKNIDKMIHYVNADGRVNAFYSNPIMYTEAKYAEKLTWPLKTDDFMPICQDHPESSGRRGHAYWSGYFSSRPLLKYYERVSSAYLNMARQLQALAKLPLNQFVSRELKHGRPSYRVWDNPSDLSPLEGAVALLTHHDGITGTSKQHVAYDYAKRVAEATVVADMVVNTALASLAGAPPNAVLVQCHLRNETVCNATALNTAPFQVVVYNPLGINRTEFIRIPVGTAGWTVTSASTGNNVAADVVPAPILPVNQTLQQTPAPYVLSFPVALAPLSVAVFTVVPGAASLLARHEKPAADFVVENEYLSLTFNGTSGRLAVVTNKEESVTATVDQGFYYYEGNNIPGKGAGAYMFRPMNCNVNATNISCVGNCAATYTVVRGNNVTEVHQAFSSWATQVIRLYTGAREVEFEWTVGQVPIGDNVGKEIVTRYTSNIASAATWYTDANAREMQTRIRDYRATYVLNLTEPQAANYFPVGAAITLNDTNAQLTITPDRAEGGTSLIDGQIELLVHRRLLVDDGEGVNEPLNETWSATPYPNFERLGPGITVRGKHYLTLSRPTTAASHFRALQDRVFQPYTLAFSNTTWAGGAVAAPGLKTALPPNVNLLTLEQRSSSNILLRCETGRSLVDRLGRAPFTVLSFLPCEVSQRSLHCRLSHSFGIGEDPVLSMPANVSLATMFSNINVKSAQELSLSANQPKSDVKRLQVGQQETWVALCKAAALPCAAAGPWDGDRTHLPMLDDQTESSDT